MVFWQGFFCKPEFSFRIRSICYTFWHHPVRLALKVRQPIPWVPEAFHARFPVAREKKPLVPRLGNLPVIRRKCCCVIIGVLGKEDRVREDHDHDDNENVKKQLVLWAQQQFCTCTTIFSTFLWRPLHDYDVKLPKCNVSWGTRRYDDEFLFQPFWTWRKYLRIQL